MSALLDAEPVVIEQLDFTPSCDWKPCDAEATWEVVLDCGCAGVVCDKHQKTQAEIDRFESGGKCNRCGQSDVHVAKWTRL